MDKLDIAKAANDLAILYVQNNVKKPDDIEEYKGLYLNAWYQFHGWLKREPQLSQENQL